MFTSGSCDDLLERTGGRSDWLNESTSFSFSVICCMHLVPQNFQLITQNYFFQPPALSYILTGLILWYICLFISLTMFSLNSWYISSIFSCNFPHALSYLWDLTLPVTRAQSWSTSMPAGRGETSHMLFKLAEVEIGFKRVVSKWRVGWIKETWVHCLFFLASLKLFTEQSKIYIKVCSDGCWYPPTLKFLTMYSSVS